MRLYRSLLLQQLYAGSYCGAAEVNGKVNMAMIRPTEEEEEEEEGCFFLQNNLLLVSAVSTATHKFLQTLQNLFAIEVSVDWLKLV